jgi:hypothetical protein
MNKLVLLVFVVALCAGCASAHFDPVPDLRPGVGGKDFGYPEMWRPREK